MDCDDCISAMTTMNVFECRSSFYGFERNVIAQLENLPTDSFYLRRNGSVVELEQIAANDLFQVQFRLVGGKGGFGSLLKSFKIRNSQNQLMCRDLSGRRLASVKEEERLRKWVAKSGEREKEAKRKREEKYEKLKRGAPKHQFDDRDYLRARFVSMDAVESALDEGFSQLDAKPAENVDSSTTSATSANVQSAANEKSEESTSANTRKRKNSASCDKEEIRAKKPLESAADDDKATFKKPEPHKKVKYVIQVRSKTPPPEPLPPPPPKAAPSAAVDSSEQNFETINLKKYESAQALVALGAAHLKHALTVRGLKCGGTLEERAERLFSVKGLKPKHYPKKIRALK